MSNNILKKCPACGNDLIISELSCQGRGGFITINHEFMNGDNE